MSAQDTHTARTHCCLVVTAAVLAFASPAALSGDGGADAVDCKDKGATDAGIKELIAELELLNTTQLEPRRRYQRGFWGDFREKLPSKEEIVRRQRKAEIAECLGVIADMRATAVLVETLKDENAFIRAGVAEALGRTGDEKAIPSLIIHLRDWSVAESAANALEMCGWKPNSTDEAILLAVARRDGGYLRKNWNDAHRVLLADVKSSNDRIIQNALFAFIGLGNESVISELTETLETDGTKITAEAYLNCGHEELARAAERWAKKRGYTITEGKKATPIGWGRM